MRSIFLHRQARGNARAATAVLQRLLAFALLGMSQCGLALAADESPLLDRNVETVLVSGATGRVGQHVIRALKDRGFHVRGITRDKAAANARFGNAYEWVEANMLDPVSIRAAVAGVDRVISAAGATRPDGPEGPQFVDYEGVVNLIDAAVEANVKQFVLVSSIGVSQRFHLLNLTFGNVLEYKRRSEDYLRVSGLDYTIVRPGGLRPGRGGLEGLALEQGDKKGGSYVIIPDVAVLLAWLMNNAAAAGKTFEVLSDPDAAPLAWQTEFATLANDRLVKRLVK